MFVESIIQSRYEVQVAPACDAEKDDCDINNPSWEIGTSGDTFKDVLLSLIKCLNDEDILIGDSWLRLVDNKTKQVIAL